MTDLTSELGYRYAEKIDHILNKCLQKHPIDDLANHGGYAALLRTVASSLQIICEEGGMYIPQIAKRGGPRP